MGEVKMEMIEIDYVCKGPANDIVMKEKKLIQPAIWYL